MNELLKVKEHTENVYKMKVPFSWDIANPLLPLRIRIEEDAAAFRKLTCAFMWKLEADYSRFLARGFTIVVTNLKKEILWVSSNFHLMTGYTPDEAIGKRPSFLQGEATNSRQKEIINQKLQRFDAVKASLINYRKNGESYLCEISIFPIENHEGLVTHFLALERSREE